MWGTSMGKRGDCADDVDNAVEVRQCSVAWLFNLVFIYAKISFNHWKLFRQTSWPSGLRRCVQVAVLIGAGSNPADVIFYSMGPAACLLAFVLLLRLAVRSITTVCSLLETTIDALPLFCQAFFLPDARPSPVRPSPGMRRLAVTTLIVMLIFSPLVRRRVPRVGTAKAKPDELSIYIHVATGKRGNHRVTSCAVFLGKFLGLKIIEKKHVCRRMQLQPTLLRRTRFQLLQPLLPRTALPPMARSHRRHLPPPQ